MVGGACLAKLEGVLGEWQGAGGRVALEDQTELTDQARELVRGFPEVQPVAGGEGVGQGGQSLKAAGEWHFGRDFVQHARGGLELAGGPQIAGALDFTNRQLGPGIGLVKGTFFTLHDNAEAGLFALLAADVAELLKQLDGRQHQRCRHGFGAAGVVHEDFFRWHFGFGEDVRDFAAQFAVAGAEFLEALDFNEARGGVPVELALDVLGIGAAAAGAEIPDVRGPVLTQHVQDWGARATH